RPPVRRRRSARLRSSPSQPPTTWDRCIAKRARLRLAAPWQKRRASYGERLHASCQPPRHRRRLLEGCWPGSCMGAGVLEEWLGEIDGAIFERDFLGRAPLSLPETTRGVARLFDWTAFEATLGRGPLDALVVARGELLS